MKRTNGGTGSFAPILRTPKSSLGRYWAIDANISDVKAAQIVTIFGTFWLLLVGLQMLNQTSLGRGPTAAAEAGFRRSAPSP
jgi:NADPH:quinone reductase-like Zn-dependent oxidoreductase